ncbi:hypothetical protein AWENTII_007252 [Aspergillus wentii]
MKWSFLAQLFPLAAAATNLTIEAGYHVIYSYPGLTPPSHLFDLIKAGKVGGLIIFGENVNDELPATIQKFQDAYTESPAHTGSPLLIMTDQEGGDIRRLPGGPELSAKDVGKAKSPEEAAADTGKSAAAALDEYHHNANLSPILGVYRENGDFLDHYERSYGNTSSLVGKCASSFIKAQQSAGVLATAKHFPGLGLAKTNENTDERPVTINATLDTLRKVDEAPYYSAVKAGVDMVMPSWAVYPAMDSKPAGLSSAWLKELRERIGFKGVTISDAIEAGALKEFGDDAARAVLATQAGMDIILASARDVSQGQKVVDALVDGLKHEKISKESFEEGSKRILELRKKIH